MSFTGRKGILFPTEVCLLLKISFHKEIFLTNINELVMFDCNTICTNIVAESRIML
jgi:hypothetical protein